jgi:hypothetical protein
MELVREQPILVPPEKVWRASTDTNSSGVAVPGCEARDKRVRWRLLRNCGRCRRTAAEGGRAAAAAGHVTAQAIPTRLHGAGGIAGFAEGAALTERLSCCFEAIIGGRRAKTASRLNGTTAKIRSPHFFCRFDPTSHTTSRARQTRYGLDARTDLPRLVACKSTGSSILPISQLGGQFTLQMPAGIWALTVTPQYMPCAPPGGGR